MDSVQVVGWLVILLGGLLILPVAAMADDDATGGHEPGRDSLALFPHAPKLGIGLVLGGIALLVLANAARAATSSVHAARTGRAEPRPPATPPASGVAERELVAVLRDRPGDAGARMVYADWLEQRGELAKANYVRAATGVRDEHGDQHISRDAIAMILATSDTAWRAVVGRERVTCKRYDCPGTWDAFASDPSDPFRRTCRVCANNVRYCADLVAMTACLDHGEPAVLDLAASRVRTGASGELEEVVIDALSRPDD